MIPVSKDSVVNIGDTPDRDPSVDWLTVQMQHSVYPAGAMSLLRLYFNDYSNLGANGGVTTNMNALLTKDIYYPYFCAVHYAGEIPTKFLQLYKLLQFVEKNYLTVIKSKPTANALQTAFKALSITLRRTNDYSSMVDFSDRLMRRVSLCPMLIAVDHKTLMEPIITSEYYMHLAPHGSIMSLILGCTWSGKIESLTTIQPSMLFHGLSQMRALDHLCAAKTLVFNTLKKNYFSKSERWTIVRKLLYDDGIFNKLVEGMIIDSGGDRNILDSLQLPSSNDFFDGIGDINLGMTFAKALLRNSGELSSFAFDPKPQMKESNGMLFFSMRSTSEDKSDGKAIARDIERKTISYKDFTTLAVRQTHDGTSTAFDDLIIDSIQTGIPIVFDFPIMSEMKEYIPKSVYSEPFTIDVDNHVTPVSLGKLQIFMLKDYKANRNASAYPYINHPMFVPVDLDYLRNVVFDDLKLTLESVTSRIATLKDKVTVSPIPINTIVSIYFNDEARTLYNEH